MNNAHKELTEAEHGLPELGKAYAKPSVSQQAADTEAHQAKAEPLKKAFPFGFLAGKGWMAPDFNDEISGFEEE